ncbi:hypothetical protein ABBQ32_011932 [Trebouxia sp. C0010 RCD-2024]
MEISTLKHPGRQLCALTLTSGAICCFRGRACCCWQTTCQAVNNYLSLWSTYWLDEDSLPWPGGCYGCLGHVDMFALRDLDMVKMPHTLQFG